MPSSITHELIACEAERTLGENIREAIGRARDYYLLGAQGPDLFFFYKPLSKREYNLGKTLHRGKLYAWFEALKAALATRSGEEYDKCLAYALGFCSHLSADVAFHPFVYGYLERTGAPKRVHQQMENDWDVYFLKKLRGGSVYAYPFPFDAKKIAREGVLYPFVRDAAEALGRKPVNKGAFKRALRFFGWYLAHFHKKHGRYLRPFAAKLYPNPEPDPAVLKGELFSEIAGTDSVDDLFARAVSESAARIEEFADALERKAPLPKENFGRHLLTGECNA